MQSTRPVILLADDFEDARDIYGSHLTLHGYDVMLAVVGCDSAAHERSTNGD